MIQTYRGIYIYPAERNASGIKYYAWVLDQKLRADTLVGIKKLISENIQKYAK